MAVCRVGNELATNLDKWNRARLTCHKKDQQAEVKLEDVMAEYKRIGGAVVVAERVIKKTVKKAVKKAIKKAIKKKK